MNQKVESKNKKLKGFSMTLLSIFLSIFILEIALRFMFAETQFLDSTTDAYWKIQLRQQLKDRTGNEDRRSDIVHDSQLGWRMRPLYQSEGVSHDGDGFRDSGNIQQTPPRQRILFIGDSFTYGLGVDNEETFSALLEQIHSPVESINAGVNGYGTDQALLMWENRGRKLNPDIVVLGFFVGDYFRNANSVRYGAKPYFAFDDNKQIFQLSGIPVPDFESLTTSGLLDAHWELRTGQAISWLLREINRKSGMINDDKVSRFFALNEYILKRLNDQVETSEAQLIILIIGHCYAQMSEPLEVEASIDKICRSNRLNCINVASMMRQENYPSFYGQNCHFSAKGHRFTANKIKEYLDLNDKLGLGKSDLL